MSVQARAIGSASGQIHNTHLGGASRAKRAKEAIVARKERLAIHARLVGWSTIMNVLEGGTANANGTTLKTMSRDGVFHICHAM